ncbi:MAG: hypothetical protein HY275_19755 [Gemmatimonadetes bacterium]|nr:hypothetical protein [Gemmatimonadota bacterium]
MTAPVTDDLDDLGEISPGNDFELLVELKKSDPATGARVGLTGRSDIVLHLALGLDLLAPFSDLQAPMGELSGRPNHYYGVIDGAALANRWGALADGTIIYPIVLLPNDRRRPFKATWRNPARG